MNIEFAAPPLIGTTKKLNGALKEWERLSDFIAEEPLETDSAAMRWAAVTTIGSAIHNIYNGLEDVMKVLCKNVDSFVPAGSSSHQEILDQMASPRKDVRPALIGEDWYPDMSELLGFRHVVNHNYANELREDLVLENLDRMKKVLPLFIAALENLDVHLSEPNVGVDGTESVKDPFDT